MLLPLQEPIARAKVRMLLRGAKPLRWPWHMVWVSVVPVATGRRPDVSRARSHRGGAASGTSSGCCPMSHMYRLPPRVLARRCHDEAALAPHVEAPTQAAAADTHLVW